MRWCVALSSIVLITTMDFLYTLPQEPPAVTERLGASGRTVRNVNTRRKSLVKGLFAEYDGSLLPNFDKDAPVTVILQVYIMSIDSISETNMDFALGMFIRQSWNDSRLAYNGGDMKLLELDTKTMDSVWIPDLYIPSEKHAALHVVTVPNKLMHVYPSGRIQYSQRVSATLKCNFDLRKYPMDHQNCLVEMESYGYTKETLQFVWHDDPVILQKNLVIPQFNLGDVHSKQCDKTYVGVTYTCVMFEFDFERSMGYYMIQVYLPSILIVMLSWVSFWLDVEAVPARISLGLLTVLTMTTQSSGARASLPKVSYIKGIDVWMSMCLIFVFMALIQFAYVNVAVRVQGRRKKFSTGIADVAMGLTNISNNRTGEEETASQSSRGQTNLRSLSKASVFSRNTTLAIGKLVSSDRDKARNVDRISRILFPSAFLIFNTIYWSVYLLWVPHRDDHH